MTRREFPVEGHRVIYRVDPDTGRDETGPAKIGNTIELETHHELYLAASPRRLITEPRHDFLALSGRIE